MPASFARLRIAGFKSFAEPTTIEVLPGLTGIVGPNGCGKSNVVEALRWAMGESSARSLRGADMDDVIFAGTAHRAARNLADVTLVLEETRNLAPPPYHEAEQLEISRRIERGSGSHYRVNGREARARDVQTLLADLASGARSSAMVSQGRVGALVGAKPEERRTILEEAAGITGLHARRHEAELKLRAAEANLERAEDLRGQLDLQWEALKRQARQAVRYRTISATIRGAEAEMFALQHARAEAMRVSAQAAQAAAASVVQHATVLATQASARATACAAALPALRESEAQARTALERHRLAGEQIAADIARARAALAEAQARAKQLEGDATHARRQHEEARTALARLEEEAARLMQEQDAHPPRVAAAQLRVTAASEALRGLEADAIAATEAAAELTARHRALQEALAGAQQRAGRLKDQHQKLVAERAQLDQGRISAELLASTEAAALAAEQAAAAAVLALRTAEAARIEAFAAAASRRETTQAEQTRLRAEARGTAEALRVNATDAHARARQKASIADSARTRLAAERQALADVLGVRDNERWPPMVDQLTVPAGLETALGAALGEALESAADTSAARHWRTLAPLSPPQELPAWATPLSSLVGAPASLARALSQIGLVDGDLDPSLLAPGQMLVSRSGAMVRWDGYAIRPGTGTAAGVRLQQRRRLAELSAGLAEAERDAEQARVALSAADSAERQARIEADTLEQTQRRAADTAETTARAAAKAAEEAASAAERQARSQRDQAEQALARLRAEQARLAAQSAATTARAAGLADQQARLAAEWAEADAMLAGLRAEAEGIADPAAARAQMEALRARVTTARAGEKAATDALDALLRAGSARAARLRHLGPEREEWRLRLREATDRLHDLQGRTQRAADLVRSLLEAPDQLAGKGRAATETLDAAEAAHRRLAIALGDGETEAQNAERATRAAEAALSAAREHLVRAEGEAAQADHAWGSVVERILERLGAEASLPPPPDDVSAEAEERLRRRQERLVREREEMGPVNLRAEIEAQEIEARIGAITREREELASAIAKLRGSIGHLNREGRERLQAVFSAVDQHFQALFARMFGGGRAHLALVGSDDPLTAGLEIFAQPPGKKLATLSLLSGGEQALTALSLIFAVFRCNPAPICVLDEVDAPLDDANVDRFCLLLEDMVKETGTRFLVITHHALTMARMDRLYGVTMQERGVSRLLSVDFARAAALVAEVVG